MGSALRFEAVSKRYSSGKMGLEKTDLELLSGTFYGMVGPNGSGKSTFIHLAAGVIRPTSGKIVRRINARREMGWVSQSVSIDWFLSVYDNVLLGSRIAGLRGSSARRMVDRCLEAVGLSQCGSRLPDQLSGGE